MSEIPTRSGHVALVGRPNVGKSTLLNALVGEKLSIVTPRAQTTREAVTGILTTDGDAGDLRGHAGPSGTEVHASAGHARHGAGGAEGCGCRAAAPGRHPSDQVPAADVVEALRRKGDAMFVIINKMDAATSGAVEALDAWSRGHLGVTPLRVAAEHGTGMAEVHAAIEERLPEGPFYYPADELAVQPVRFFVAELIRETIFERYDEEVPYSTIVRVEEYREADDPLYIRATVYVERDTQKAILLGKGGVAIRELGRHSREKIETFVGARVYLDLWVKVLPNWRASTRHATLSRLPPAVVAGDSGRRRGTPWRARHEADRERGRGDHRRGGRRGKPRGD
jgi:GTPase